MTEKSAVPHMHKLIVAAAVQALLGRHARVLWIRPLDGSRPGPWVRQARTAVQLARQRPEKNS